MKVGIFLNVILNHLTIADGVEENRGVYCPRRGRAPTIMKYRFFSFGSKIGPSGDNRMIFFSQIRLIFLVPMGQEWISQRFGKVPKKQNQP